MNANPPPVGVTVRLLPHDPEWAARYRRLADRVRAALGERVLLLEHAGSTSVAGLSAKPVIDMVLAVADSTDEQDYVPDLERAGFRFRLREPDWYEHRLFHHEEIECKLHVFSQHCEEIDRMLRFRDRLRANAEDRRLYEETKRALAERKWPTVQHYADAKSEVIREILERSGS